MSGSKINPKVQSANDAMIAEMLIEEIDKLSGLYTKVLESEDKLEKNYQKIEGILILHKQDVNAFANNINTFIDYINKYENLSLNAIKLSNQLVDISKVGFTVDEASRKEIFEIANEGVKPVMRYLKWLTYGVGLAFILLLLSVLLL